MPCQVIAVDPQYPSAAAIARAGQVIRSGGLVAFPTETVYGLGANALDASAVARIFVAKGRPAKNPIIVHVATCDEAKHLAAEWPDTAQTLAARFWPGPLTLVLRKRGVVPDLVTAGGPTVGLRIPAHAVALALLRACNVPLAAPSANASAELSPTRAEHVVQSIGVRIDLVLDAGPTSGGLESTVLDLATTPPAILRPGLITRSAIESVIGPIESTAGDEPGQARSPGQMRRHYAPRTRLQVACDSQRLVDRLAGESVRVGWLTHRDEDAAAVWRILLPLDPVSYSAQLYDALHRLDAAGLDRIIVEAPPPGDEWLAVHDRLRRASEQDEE
jgi:L-threonylcarbamoyladenylate synthase